MALDSDKAVIDGAKAMADQAKIVAKLRAERTNLRRLFTVASSMFDDIHRKINIEKDIHIQYNKVAEKAERLFKVDEEIKDFIDFTDEDYDLIESYRDKFTEIRVIYEKHYNQHDERTSVSSNKFMPDNLKLPKLRLKEYDLIPRTWVAFWGQFSRIHEDENLREEDKFQYLLSSLKSKTKARDIVESYPPSKGNYEKVIDHLKSRFGRKDLLIEVYIRDLLALVSNKSNVKLSDLYDKLGSYLRALETLGVTTANYAAMLYPVVESCLSAEILKAWDRYRLNKEIEEEDQVLTKEKVLENLMSFLRHEVEGEEHRFLAENAFGSSGKRKDYQKPIQRNEPTASTLIANTSVGRSTCIFCDRSHPSQECQKISSKNYDDRKSQVMRKKCCLVCLKPGHMAKNCRSIVRCLICERRHYTILCPNLRKDVNSPKDKVGDEVQKSTETLLTNHPSEHEIYLKTITVRLRHRNKEVCVRALMDDGSHRSYIEKSLAAELNLSPSGKEVLSQGLFGGGVTPAVEHGKYTVTIKSLDNKYTTSLSLLDQQKICSTLPRIRDENLLAELASRGIKLTDIGKDTPPIRVLLGADVLGSLLTGRIEVLPSGVSAVETLLGWTILGLGRKRQIINMVTLTLQNIELPKIWDLDVLGIVDPVERKNKTLLEEETLSHFRETIKVCEDQRYEVALPWLAGHPALYDKCDIAESRLRIVTKRLLNENNFELYDAVFKQWESERIIETVPREQISKSSHYLPHRPVIKLSSSTTKVRPVFDASFKRPGYASLNECLSVGPNLLQQILPLLLKFRSGAVGVIADIKQAFLQIRLRDEDRDVLRFLWWEDTERTKFKIYRHCRVVFGISSSPFLLNSTINHHLGLQKFQVESLQNTIQKLKEGFYVDNLVTSVNDLKELKRLKSQAIEVLREGGFELRCWASNACNDDQDSTQMVLGLKWNVICDELSCKLPENLDLAENENRPITKRVLLSVINSIYDPIGFTAPALLLPKLLLQEAWKEKLDWDHGLSTDLEQKYRRWEKTTALISECTISRRMFPEDYDEVTLHIFTDASSYAYAACAFLRCEYQGQVTVKLIAAKSRVAPLQRPTIPRLELLGAAVGARLAATLRSVVPSISRTLYWSDSMVVLSWITKTEPWNTFVGNRVKEIRELTDIDDWRHIRGEVNPADLATRYCDWSDLLQSQWWEGPSWLYVNKEHWPTSEISVPEEAFLERRKTVVTSLVTEDKEKFGDRFLYFSNYTRILRMTAYVLRFCNNVKKNSYRLSNELSCGEIETAENTLIKIIQAEWPPQVREKYNNTIQFYTENGTLRVQTRLILSQDPDNFTRPIVLPDHPIVERLIWHTHRSLMHAGMLTTLSQLRERFWIPKGRRVVGAVLRKCVVCKKMTSKNVNPDPAPLPPDRIKRVSAFQITGADLAGPLYLRGGSKAWIVIFTCAVYRAIHLELVSSLSTEAFIQALRRFWARRGRCSTLYTDNGTNFTGASNALKSLDWSLIQTECAVMKIKWLFSPPSAPWYGGFWERMVRSVKALLRKSLGKACVTYEEMLTLLNDCEATINGRPLTYLSDDPNELKPLTPAHFIQDIREQETIDLDLIDSQHLLKRVRYIQTLRSNLRKRFYTEYLGELVRNPKTASKRKVIAPGEIVLVESKTPNKLNWPLARVIEIFPGKDDVERVVKLRVANGEIIRPVQRVYPLELSSDDKLGEVPKETKATVREPEPSSDVPAEVKVTRRGRKIVPVKRLNL